MTSEMFDSIDPSQIPAGQDDAGYVDGRWRTFTVLHGPHNLSVAVFASDDADALDDEPGDATNAQAPGWVKRELSLGHWRPCLYTSVSNLPALLAALAAAGIARGQVRIWTAHYTYRSHRCTRVCNAQFPADFTADATQWTDRSGGRNLDESTIADDFFGTPPPPPPPAPTPCTIGGHPAMRFPINLFKTDAAGWYAEGLVLPAGKTKDDVFGILCDAASGYDPQGWHRCDGYVDFQDPGQPANVIRLVFRSEKPSDSFTARVFVTD